MIKTHFSQIGVMILSVFDNLYGDTAKENQLRPIGDQCLIREFSPPITGNEKKLELNMYLKEKTSCR